MNVNLGAPYEAIIERFMARGYAGNQTEVLRQALVAYERQVDEEEVILVSKGVAEEKRLMEERGEKMIPLAKIKAKYGT